MCGNHLNEPAIGEQWLVDNPVFREFIDAVNEARKSSDDPEEVIAAIRPHFEEIMKKDGWLPEKFMNPAEGSGMGSGIGMWLLYRSLDGSLAFSSLVVPPGAETPVHDHLAWGLIGLYRGEQSEHTYTRKDDGSTEGEAELTLMKSQHLKPGNMYALLPEVDIHKVKTTGDQTSVSLHLLGIDNGCIWRHRFFPEEHKVVPFKSGYVNLPCEETESVAD